MKSRSRGVCTAVALMAALAPGAHGQTQTPATPQNRGVIELMNQIETLNAELNRIRGDLEVINNGLENAQRRQRDMYLDLDTRLRRLEAAPEGAAKSDKSSGDLEARIKRLEEASGSHGGRDLSELDARVKRLEALAPGAPSVTASPPASAPAPLPPVSTAAPAVPAPTPPTVPSTPSVQKPTPAGAASSGTESAAARRAYDAALNTYRSGDYQGAITAFDAFVKRYPRDALAPNAQYWIGDAWFNLRDFRAAAAAQQALVNNYPDSPKVSDALLNLSSAQLALGENANARKTLEDLVARFPQSEAAEKARQRLAKFR
ncbi:MAG TPA: tol-pal system protein YbgF [Burkholderiales bacterium]|nr:tol-pal system protein YbgF [Burkholderiales bacterium]